MEGTERRQVRAGEEVLDGEGLKVTVRYAGGEREKERVCHGKGRGV